MEILKKAIKLAGGIPVVAYCCSTPDHDVSIADVKGWLTNGLPDSEWSGTTHYAETIAAMQNEVTVTQMIIETRRSKNG